MKKFLNSKIVRKYRTQIVVILLFVGFLIYLIFITNGYFIVPLILFLLIMLLIPGNFLNDQYLIKKYIGNRIKTFGQITIHEGGFYIGDFFVNSSRYYKKVEIDCFSWNHLKKYKWDDDLGQIQYGITFILDDGLREKRNFWRNPVDFHQFNDLGNGLYQFKIFINRSYMDEITYFLQKYLN